MWQIAIILCVFVLNIMGQMSAQSLNREVLTEDILEGTLSSELENADELAEYAMLMMEGRAKVDLNGPHLDRLAEYGLVSPRHVQAILDHRKAYGKLVSVYELQAVPGLDTSVIRALLPYITVNDHGAIRETALRRPLMGAKQNLAILLSRNLEKARGFQQVNEKNPAYSGDPWRVRIRHTLRTKHFRVDLAAEKDPGEPLFDTLNPAGFDHYGYHISAFSLTRWMPVVALGNHEVLIGHGLLGRTAFGVGKNAIIANIANERIGVRPAPSTSEYDHLHGVAAEFRPVQTLRILLGYSGRRRDANIAFHQHDSLTNKVFTSLLTSGNHRTPAEIADKRQVSHRTITGAIRFEKRHARIGLNLRSHRFSIPWNRNDRLYNKYRFQGDRLLNTSVDYSAIVGGWRVFGEIAWSSNNACALFTGAMTSLHPKVDLVASFRHYARHFHAVESRAFGESADSRNETGFYTGLIIQPSRAIRISCYSDIWKNPWPTYNNDGPGKGHEHFVRVTFKKRKKYDLYFQFRNKTRERTVRSEAFKTERSIMTSRSALRIHFAYHISSSLELRNRLEFTLHATDNNPASRGSLFYQDVHYKPIDKPIRIALRVALFDIADYDARIYAFENDHTSSFSIPPHFNNGIRCYMNFTWKINRNITLTTRVGRWEYFNTTTIGSANDEIAGRNRTDLRLMLRYTIDHSEIKSL